MVYLLYALLILKYLYPALGLILVFWIYNDISNKGGDPIMWTIIVLFTGPLGALVYFIFARPTLANVQHNYDDGGDEYSLRAKFRKKIDAGKLDGGIMPPPKNVNPDFSDRELDELIAEGKYTEAKASLDQMKEIARNQNDRQALDNYAKYDYKLAQSLSAEVRKFRKRTGEELDPR